MNYFTICSLVILSALCSSSSSTLASTEILKQTAVRLENGSGAIVKAPSGKKYLLTNSHVCMGAKWKGKVKATFENGTIVLATVKKDSIAADLCAAEVDKKLPALNIGDAIKRRDEVCTRGYPFGVLTESCGIVGGVSMWTHIYPIEMIGECVEGTKKQYHPGTGRLYGCSKNYTSVLTTLYARPGSSGSAVVNDKGELVGVVSDWQPGEETEAGMVPLELIHRFFGDL